MIMPLLFFLIAVAALVGMFHVTTLWSQIVLAWWVIGGTWAAMETAATKAPVEASTTKAKGR